MKKKRKISNLSLQTVPPHEGNLNFLFDPEILNRAFNKCHQIGLALDRSQLHPQKKSLVKSHHQLRTVRVMGKRLDNNQ